MRGRRLAALLAVALVYLAATRTAAAQTSTAEISGTVHDSQGGVLPGVTVAAVNSANGTRVERVSDERGRYRLPELPSAPTTLPRRFPASRARFAPASPCNWASRSNSI
jgi:hypothetical protein